MMKCSRRHICACISTRPIWSFTGETALLSAFVLNSSGGVEYTMLYSAKILQYHSHDAAGVGWREFGRMVIPEELIYFEVARRD